MTEDGHWKHNQLSFEVFSRNHLDRPMKKEQINSINVQYPMPHFFFHPINKSVQWTPWKTQFYIGKSGPSRVYIIFLILAKKVYKQF